MNVLIACEESQAVCTEFRKKGHTAFSCDLEPCSGGHPEWHIKGDALAVINGMCEFDTENGSHHDFMINKKWDLIIAHPPCTYLTVTGNSWFDINKYGDKARKRYRDRYESIVFFMHMMLADCKKIAVENPIGIMSTAYRTPDCIIQPYMFGDPERKGTCLWLKGLEPLKPTNIVEPNLYKFKSNGKTDPMWHYETMKLPPKERAKARSKTFPGIAKAMAEQWG